MKMLVFYRSREYSNAIISSTRDKLSKNKSAKNLDIEFINLDKRNYVKVLSQMEELPRYIYIWYDEEKLTDYIKETYPSIEVIHFDKNSTVEYHNDWYGNPIKEYKLADMIFELFKKNLAKRTIYQVDANFDIIQTKMDDIDIANSKYCSFETKDMAVQYCVDCLKKDIETTENKIIKYKRSIDEYKSTLRKSKSLLKKYSEQK